MATRPKCFRYSIKPARRTDNRPSARDRGYTTRWDKYRRLYLRDHPLCVECAKRDRLTPATVVDHITDHKGDSELFWNPENHQPLCRLCHDRKPKEPGEVLV